MRQDLVLYNLTENLRSMLKVQEDVLQGTTELDRSVSARPNGRPARSDIKQRTELASKQGEAIELARKAAEVMDKEDSRVFSRIMALAADEMGEVVELLKKNQFGSYNQEVQRQIIFRLTQMLDAFNNEKKERDEQRQQQQQQGQQQQGQMEQRLIPRIAELKTIRNEQVDIKQQTEALKKRFEALANDPQVADEVKLAAAEELRRFIRRTSQKQGNLAGMLDEFIKSLEGKKGE